jgi:HAD superfamily hydrolase (TIGR01490 family)
VTYTPDPRIRAALFDIDGTLTTGGDVWGPLVKSPEVQPRRRAWLYASAWPQYALSKARVISQAGFRDRWVRLMAMLMGGWTSQQVQDVYGRMVSVSLLPLLRSDVVDILRQHKTQGQPVLLISTMFEGIVQALAEYVGADAGLGSRLELRDDTCTGKIVGQTCAGARKLAFARAYLAQNAPDLTLDDCAAYADSRSDISFLSGVGYPVAVYPDEAMRHAALERGWPMIPAR